MSVKRLCAAFLAYFLPVARQHRSRKINGIKSKKGGSAATRVSYFNLGRLSGPHQKIQHTKVQLFCGWRRGSAPPKRRSVRARTHSGGETPCLSAPGARLLPRRRMYQPAGAQLVSVRRSRRPVTHSKVSPRQRAAKVIGRRSPSFCALD